jgi:hypothetical protein
MPTSSITSRKPADHPASAQRTPRRSWTRPRARATGGTTARKARTTYGDDQDMTNETTTAHGSNPEDPEDRQVALITTLIKIFATDRGDSPIEPAPRHPR